MGMAGLAVEATREMRHRSADARASRHGALSANLLARAIFNLTVLACAVILGPHAAWSKPAVRILMLGDSITAGYGLPEAESLPQVLQTALRKTGHEVQVMNGGVSGDTTAGGLARVGWMLQEQPQIVIVELGANDGLRGLDPKESYANLDKLLAVLASAKLKVLLAGMLAPPILARSTVKSSPRSIRHWPRSTAASSTPFSSPASPPGRSSTRPTASIRTPRVSSSSPACSHPTWKSFWEDDGRCARTNHDRVPFRS